MSSCVLLNYLKTNILNSDSITIGHVTLYIWLNADYFYFILCMFFNYMFIYFFEIEWTKLKHTNLVKVEKRQSFWTISIYKWKF